MVKRNKQNTSIYSFNKVQYSTSPKTGYHSHGPPTQLVLFPWTLVCRQNRKILTFIALSKVFEVRKNKKTRDLKWYPVSIHLLKREEKTWKARRKRWHKENFIAFLLWFKEYKQILRDEILRLEVFFNVEIVEMGCEQHSHAFELP